MRRNKLLLILFIALGLTACKDKDSLGPCASVGLACNCSGFVVYDKWGKILIGRDNTYHPDSLKLYNDQQVIPLQFSEYPNDTLVEFNFSRWKSSEEYYLRLSQNETDTIKLDIKNIEGECGLSREITSFQMYGAKVADKAGTYTIIKM